MVAMVVSELTVHRPGRHHHRPRAVVRHADRALVDDAVDRRAAGQVVLVAAAGAATAGARAVAGQTEASQKWSVGALKEASEESRVQ